LEELGTSHDKTAFFKIPKSLNSQGGLTAATNPANIGGINTKPPRHKGFFVQRLLPNNGLPPGRAWSVLILNLPREIHANDSEADFTGVFLPGSEQTHHDFFASIAPWRFTKTSSQIVPQGGIANKDSES